MSSQVTAATKHRQSHWVHHHLQSCQTPPTWPPWNLPFPVRLLHLVSVLRRLQASLPPPHCLRWETCILICRASSSSQYFLAPASCSSWPHFTMLSVSKPAWAGHPSAWPTRGTWSLRKPPTGAAPLKPNQWGTWSEWSIGDCLLVCICCCCCYRDVCIKPSFCELLICSSNCRENKIIKTLCINHKRMTACDMIRVHSHEHNQKTLCLCTIVLTKVYNVCKCGRIPTPFEWRDKKLDKAAHGDAVIALYFQS